MLNPKVALLKRLMDIVMSTFGLTLLLPLLPLIAIAIKMESEGPIFFKQERVGLDGTPIIIYKFRTMFQDAEKLTGPIWAGAKDKRITRTGRILRKLHLDETPQFYNAFKGDMSMVGPRPERQFFVDQLTREIPLYDERIMLVKPGITGLAQIRCGYDTSPESVKMKLLYDHSYAASLTRVGSFLSMDLSIILETFVYLAKKKKKAPKQERQATHIDICSGSSS